MTFLTKTKRNIIIKRVSITDFILNCFMGLCKVFIALFSGSLAIASDSVLNFGDALTSILTFIGINISKHTPTKEHPFGFGRVEYLTSLLTSSILIAVSLEFGKSAIDRILNSQETHVSNLQIIFLVIFIFIKFFLYFFNKKMALKTHSDSLLESAHDSMIDLIGTSVTVFLVFLDRYIEISLDPWISLGVSFFIILSSISSILKTISHLIGQSPSQVFINNIKTTTLKNKNVTKISNIRIHNYGYNVSFGEMKLSLVKNLNEKQIEETLDNIEKELKQNYNINFSFNLN